MLRLLLKTESSNVFVALNLYWKVYFFTVSTIIQKHKYIIFSMYLELSCPYPEFKDESVGSHIHPAYKYLSNLRKQIIL